MNSPLLKIKLLLQNFGALIPLYRSDRQVLIRVRKKRYTYLSWLRLSRIMRNVRAIEKQNLPGIFIEAGCALGGSAITIASAKKPNRPLQLYDVFDQIPPPTNEDPPEVHQRYQTIVEGKSKGLGQDIYYGYQSNLEQKVHQNLDSFGFPLQQNHITTHAGLVQDQLKGFEKVAFAHIDVDWYAPVKYCLEQIFPRLVPGGCIILDDYNDWGGCRKATDEFLGQQEGNYVLDYTKEALKITRI